MQIKQRYFDYICDLMRMDLPEHRDYTLLMADLYDKEFIYSVDLDENRVFDALDLRREFLFDCGFDIIRDYWEDHVSVLEVLAALSKRMEIEITGEPGNDDYSRWFWEMLENLDVLYLDDEYDREIVEDNMDVWLCRKFEKSGKGGIFPLKKLTSDQRENDIWYQGQLYLSENWHF